MLFETIINKPLPRFILIQDSYEEKQNKILESIISKHVDCNNVKIHLFSFEDQIQFENNLNITLHHMNGDKLDDRFLPVDTSLIQDDTIFIIDSLADLIYIYGEAFCISEIKKLLDNNKNIAQFIAVLHRDLFETSKTAKNFSFMSSLNINMVNKSTVEYFHKKQSGKVIRKVVTIDFKNNLQCREIDQKKVTAPEPTNVLPNKLTTFKISLEENEIESRNKNLVLPYLKKDEEKGKPLVTIGGSSGGKIIYLPDDNDDFDEEDPDDDLDV